MAGRTCSLGLFLMVFFLGCDHAFAFAPLASFYGDPHFQGADGIKFHFSGKPHVSYCLFSDPSLHMNILMDGYEDASGVMRTWVKGLAISVKENGLIRKKHQLELHARSGPEASNGEGFVRQMLLNGEEKIIQVGQMLSTEGGHVKLEHMGVEDSGKGEVESYRLTIADSGEFVLKVQPEAPELRTERDAFVHFSVDVMGADILSNPHGIMGQTFRKQQKERTFTFQMRFNPDLQSWQVAGENGEGYLDGKLHDYETSSLSAEDCAFSRFEHSADDASEAEARQEWGEVEEVTKEEALVDPMVPNVTAEGEEVSGTESQAKEIAGLRKFEEAPTRGMGSREDVVSPDPSQQASISYVAVDSTDSKEVPVRSRTNSARRMGRP